MQLFLGTGMSRVLTALGMGYMAERCRESESQRVPGWDLRSSLNSHLLCLACLSPHSQFLNLSSPQGNCESSEHRRSGRNRRQPCPAPVCWGLHRTILWRCREYHHLLDCHCDGYYHHGCDQSYESGNDGFSACDKRANLQAPNPRHGNFLKPKAPGQKPTPSSQSNQ